MTPFLKAFRTIVCGLAASACSSIAVNAQAIALRNGESAELEDVYYVSRDCKSLLTAAPEVEVMNGPPGIAVAIKDAMVTPRALSCASPVRGGKLTITATDVAKQSASTLVLRFKYKTRSGARQGSRSYKLSLFPTAKAEDSVAVKSGETIELGDVYWVAKCRSTMIGLPTIEVMEGAPELSFAVKEAMVVPRKYGCDQTVEGGKLVLTAGTIAEAKEAKIVYRLHYKLIDGERQLARTRKFMLFP